MATDRYAGHKVPRGIDPQLRKFLEDVDRGLQRISNPEVALNTDEDADGHPVYGTWKAGGGSGGLPVQPMGTVAFLEVQDGTVANDPARMKLRGDFEVKDGPGFLVLGSNGERWIEVARSGSKNTLSCPVIINEDGEACQPVLRVETANNANAIYVDGLNDYIGIGTNAPGALLDVRGDAVFNEDGGDFDFRIEGDTVPFMFNVDASQDVLSIGEIAQAGGTNTGGRVQILGSPTVGGSFSDQANKMLWIKYNAAITSGSESGVHRGIYLDWDHDFGNAAGILTYTMKPFELDIDLTRSVAPLFASTTIEPFKVSIDIDTNLDAGGSGSPDSPLQFVVNHNTSTATNVPSNGYINYTVSCNGASAIAQNVLGVQYAVTGKNTGATNNLTALQVNLTGATGVTANMRGIACTVTPKSTANRVRVFEATLGAGSPAADLVMAFFGANHILSNSSIIAAAGATPNAVGPSRVSFTDGTANLYAEDNLEVGGVSYLEGGVIANESGVNVDFRVEGLTDPNLFFVDASTNRVGIGMNNPSELFEVDGDARVTNLGVNQAAGATNGLAVSGAVLFNLNNTVSNALDLQVSSVSKLRYDTTGTRDTLEIGRGQSTSVAFGSDTRIGFHGTTPIGQPAPGYTQTYATATQTHSNPTAATLTDSTGGTANQTLVAISGTADDANINDNFADLADEVNKLITDLANAKQVLNQVIDDLQAYGLVA